MRDKLNFESFLIGGSKIANVDLSSSKVPTQPPKFLDNYGKRLWPKLANYLNNNLPIVRADEYLLQEYCSAYDVYRKAYESIKKDGLQKVAYKSHYSPTDGKELGEPDFVGFKKNPAYAMMSDAITKMNSIGHELGLSPSAREEMLRYEGTSDKKEQTAGESFKEFFK